MCRIGPTYRKYSQLAYVCVYMCVCVSVTVCVIRINGPVLCSFRMKVNDSEQDKALSDGDFESWMKLSCSVHDSDQMYLNVTYHHPRPGKEAVHVRLVQRVVLPGEDRSTV